MATANSIIWLHYKNIKNEVFYYFQPFGVAKRFLMNCLDALLKMVIQPLRSISDMQLCWEVAMKVWNNYVKSNETPSGRSGAIYPANPEGRSPPADRGFSSSTTDRTGLPGSTPAQAMDAADRMDVPNQGSEMQNTSNLQNSDCPNNCHCPSIKHLLGYNNNGTTVEAMDSGNYSGE